MFTGIVQGVGVVRLAAGNRLEVEPPDAWPGEDWQQGESVAVDGCCLSLSGAPLSFDLSDETLSRTKFGRLAEGSPVHLERALRLGDRLGGHWVTGHVDEVGEAQGFRGGVLSVRCARPELLVDKGSVCVDGVSLTVVLGPKDGFSAALVPETLARTTLGRLQPGDPVHIEYDILAKHVARLVGRRG